MDKRLKDPIYGYIEIPVEFTNNVIDTPAFQRLRRIIQTSYAPLYSSAIHNRFVHSIGVFHLGRIASEQLQNELMAREFCDKDKINKYVQIYQFACLLHDVGHAPFSHTGEGFYRTEDFKSVQLHKMLVNEVGSKEFERNIPAEESNAAAPHEIMSCIIGIREFGSLLLVDSSEREFFARCITGYEYSEHNEDNDIKNCFISMLNSKVIDVDRLDYLIRDAYITGFETVNIDYIRLLKALTIVNYEGHYRIAYRKDALSIIENAVYAHDAEKKWIQNHPVVLYESYLIKHIITHLNEKLNQKKKKLFSAEALSETGVKFKNGIKVSLMCDDDIVYLFKNLYSDDVSEEFFDRRKRRHPVWKSESEYKAYIDSMSPEGQLKEEFLDCLKSFIGGNQKDMQYPIIINEELENKLQTELADSQEALKTAQDRTTCESIKQQQNGTRNRLSLCKYLNKYAREHGLADDFIIIKADMFNSSFSKTAITNLLIVFDQGDRELIMPISKVCTTLKAEEKKEEFYYLYYRGVDSEKIIDKQEFCCDLYNAAHSLKKID